MALGPLEALVIVGIILVILFFLIPGKLPKLARSVAEAKREFEEASKRGEFLEEARRMGIDVTGKTREEIEAEMARKRS